VESTVTNPNGGFLFDSVARGSYVITVQHPDYLPLSQQVSSDGRRIFGLQLALRKKPAAAGPPAANPDPGAPVRATGIPRAAQEAMNRGMDLLYVKSDLRGSLSQFERAIKEYPGFYEAYTQVGVAHTNLGDSANAEKAFRKAIELSQEKYVDAYAGLAVLLSNAQKYADAEVVARKAVELSPNDWRGLGELGRALHGLQRYQDAEAPVAAAVKLAPDNPPLHLLQASIHLQAKNYRAMLDDLNTYLKLVPTGPEADRIREMRDKVQQAVAGAPPAPQSPQPAPAPQP
jgi:tetratricopeptide (TPR) repeat protein